MGSVSVIFDQGNLDDSNATNSLVRIFDPTSERRLQLPRDFTLPSTPTTDVAGRKVFSDLPHVLRSRLFYEADGTNKALIFKGVADSALQYGGTNNPLLLVNVMSARERDRIKQLSSDNRFQQAVDDLYDLTRNPNRLDLDSDGQPDKGLLMGLIWGSRTNPLTSVVTTNIVHEQFGDGDKALTAGLALGSGFVTLVENNDQEVGVPPSLWVVSRRGRPLHGPFEGHLPGEHLR
jgi:hypothetical protein